jgi:hypothetical protein
MSAGELRRDAQRDLETTARRESLGHGDENPLELFNLRGDCDLRCAIFCDSSLPSAPLAGDQFGAAADKFAQSHQTFADILRIHRILAWHGRCSNFLPWQTAR